VNHLGSPPCITPEDFATATAAMTSAGVKYDLAVTPTRLPRATYLAMRKTWHAFRRGVDAFIDLHERDIPRITAALSIPACYEPLWGSMPAQDWNIIARPDIIVSQGRPLLVDVNSSSNAGHFPINDMLLRAHRTKPLRGSFSSAGEPRFVMGHYADLLRRFLRDEDDIIALSYFAEEDAGDVSSFRFHYQTEIDELARLGLTARMTHIEDLEVKADGVYHQERRVGLIQRYFIPTADPGKIAEIARIGAAARDGLVAIWTGIWSSAFDNKALIASLSDERFTEGLEASLGASLGQAVPWTRVIEERCTRWHDSRVDLLPWIEENREKLVIKPALGFMGQSLMVGRETSQSAWAEQIKDALAAEQSWVVQELLLADPQKTTIVDRSGRAYVQEGPAVYGAFVIDGEFIGAICRLGRHGYSGLMINGLTGAIPAPVYWSAAD
jgi:hypothetical protein